MCHNFSLPGSTLLVLLLCKLSHSCWVLGIDCPHRNVNCEQKNKHCLCAAEIFCVSINIDHLHFVFFSAFASTILVSLAFIENKHCCSQLRGLIGDLLHQCLPVVIRMGGETDSSSTALSAMQIPTKFSSLSINEAPSFFYIHPISDSPFHEIWTKIPIEEILNHLGGDPSCSSFCGSCVTPRCHQNEN